MGQLISDLTLGTDERRARLNRDPVFVVPIHLNLSMAQMSTMIEAGQQPGVPFHLGGNGAQRPQGTRVKVNFCENFVSLRRNSLKVMDCGSDRFSISFSYDASIAAKAMIFIGAQDRSSGKHLRIEKASVTWGPFSLEQGNKLLWNSKKLKLFARETHFPGRHSESVTADLYDVVVALSPLGLDSTSFSLPRELNSTPRILKEKLVVNEKPTTESSKSKSLINNFFSMDIGASTTSAASTSSPGSASPRSKPRVSSSSSSSSLSSSSTPPRTPSGIDVDVGVEKSNNNASNRVHAIGAADEPGVMSRHSSKHSPILIEASFGRLTTMGKTCAGAVQNDRGEWIAAPILIKCEVQKVQTQSAVYVTQDIYGMDRASGESSGNLSTISNPTDRSIAGAGEGNDGAAPPRGSDDTLEEGVGAASSSGGLAAGSGGTGAAGGGGAGADEDLDTDSSECVICLSDPRQVAVYPCRHMCMCSSCAEALPAQGNKCPICRRLATMLLIIRQHKADKLENISTSSPSKPEVEGVGGTSSRQGFETVEL